jgi:hypothetical protein
MPGLLRHAPAGMILMTLLLAGSRADAGAMTTPAMGGELVANPNPFSFDAGPLGTIYVIGALSGLASWQDNPVPGDREARADLANGQLFVQKTDGWFQFYADAGTYTLPSLGTPFMSVGHTAHDTYGYLPQAWLKIAPTENFSIQAGQLAALVGNENAFTFQNFNIERGLLWNQTPLFSRGVQANYTSGPLTLQLSLNDGYYSDRFNWLTWQAVYSLNDGADVFSFNGGANLGRTSYSSLVTPLAQNNSAIGDLIYTHTSGSWIVSPYIQFSDVPQAVALGFIRNAISISGAVLASYAITPELFLAGRAEYIDTGGGGVAGTPNLLYGPGSDAWSLTFTPTFQHGVFYARGEASYIGALDAAAGDGFGRTLDKSSQVRLMLEAGVVF